MPLAAATGAEQTLFQYGALGAITVVLIVFARTAYKDLRSRADRLETRNVALSDSLREQVVPALVASGEGLRESAAALRESATLITELRRDRDQLIEELRRAQTRPGQQRGR